MRTPTTRETRSLIEFTKRRNMSISMFRPMEHQEPFFRNYARERLLRGGNRSGKSVCAAAMFAATAMDMPITLDDGTEVEMRQPWQKGRPLRMWIIGFDLKHIGQTIYHLLFKAGRFKIIKDEDTGLFRTYKEWEPADKARESEAKPSPPLIPMRWVKPKSWVWEEQRSKQFTEVTIQHPQTKQEIATIYCYSSRAEPKAGDPVDVIWIDESIYTPEHYPEWQARLADFRGHMFWSSWPNASNDALQSLTERALEEKNKPNPLVRETVIALSENKQMPEENREEQLGMFSDEVRRARDLGEYVTDQVLAYPMFNEYLHQAMPAGVGDRIADELRKRDGLPPNDWTHELILDPGTSHPGILLCAIPPISLGEYFVVYDEIYPGRCDALELAMHVQKKSGGRVFYRMIADYQAGRQQAMGFSVRVIDNYVFAFKKRRIRSSMSGYAFIPGSNDVGGRIGQLQEWMHMQPSGLPKLRIVRQRCPELCKQLRKYRKACVNNEVKDDRPARGQQIDLAQCLEYWASSGPRYVLPKEIPEEDPNLRWYFERFGRGKKKRDRTYTIGPPTSTGA